MRTVVLGFLLAALGCSSTTNSDDASVTDAQSLDAADARANDTSTVPDRSAVDAPANDTGVDVTRVDAGCVRALPTEYVIGSDGGNAQFRDEYTLSPPARFVLRRGNGSTVSAMCETEIPVCVSPDMVDVGVVAAALSHPDVTALLDMHNALVGRDSRPIDGSLFVIRRGTDTLLVGDSCRDGAGMGCTPVPTGVQRAVDILTGLIEQERQRQVCRTALGM